MVKEEPDTRTVHCIIDPNGGVGKSTLCDYLQYMGMGKALVPMASMEDLMQAVFNIGKQRCYLMDMPKGTPKDKLGPLYAGIEKIKDGMAYDKRYSYKELLMMEPHFFVFTNKWPELNLLSPDRWKLYAVINKVLVRLRLPAVHTEVDMQEWLHKHCPDAQLEHLAVPAEPLSWVVPPPVTADVAVPVAAAVAVPGAAAVAVPVAAAASAPATPRRNAPPPPPGPSPAKKRRMAEAAAGYDAAAAQAAEPDSSSSDNDSDSAHSASVCSDSPSDDSDSDSSSD